MMTAWLPLPGGWVLSATWNHTIGWVVFLWLSVKVLGGGACVRIQAVFSGRRTRLGAVDLTVVQRLGALAVGLARVITEDTGVDAGQRTHAAAVTWVESSCTQFQLVITRHTNERTPPESPFEACSEPAGPQGIICTLPGAFKCQKCKNVGVLIKRWNLGWILIG